MIDFRKRPTYDFILARLFMRQTKLIKDWRSNYLYLYHANAMTRVSTLKHSHKDVNNTLVEEYDSWTTINSRVPMWKYAKAYCWMCGALYHNNLLEE